MKTISVTQPNDYEELTEAEREYIERSVVDLGLPPLPERWNTSGSDEQRLILVELILITTPNLEVLGIPLDYGWDMHIVQHQVPRPFLPKLRRLDVLLYYVSGDRFEVSMHPLKYLLSAAPNLERLHVPSIEPANGPFPLNNLRRLEFSADCSVSPDLLRQLLSSAPRLEVFALHWDAIDTAYDFTDDRRAADAWLALEQRADTLREIRLDIRDDLPLGRADRLSLQDFVQLQVLKVDGHALNVLREAWQRKNPRARIDSFLSQLLPSSIREVTFWRLDIALSAAMLRLAKVASLGRYPELRNVVLSPSERSDRSCEEWPNFSAWEGVEAVLKEDFARGGVNFTLRTESGYWSEPPCI
jgi:hypothetical protein